MFSCRSQSQSQSQRSHSKPPTTKSTGHSHKQRSKSPSPRRKLSGSQSPPRKQLRSHSPKPSSSSIQHTQKGDTRSVIGGTNIASFPPSHTPSSHCLKLGYMHSPYMLQPHIMCMVKYKAYTLFTVLLLLSISFQVTR